MVDGHGADFRIGEQTNDGRDPDGALAVDRDEPGITEDQLTAMALAADPCLPMDEGAVPLSVYLGQLGQVGGLLPQWYMPTPMARRAKGWRVPVVLIIVGAFVVIEALGLCNTFGQLVPG
jgi:hypothetical protein